MRSRPRPVRIAPCALVLALAVGTIGSPRAAWAQDAAFLVKDITPGPGGSYWSDLTEVNGRLLLTAGGTGLWRSDGTAASTLLVGNVTPPGSYVYSVTGFTNVDGTLFIG